MDLTRIAALAEIVNALAVTLTLIALIATIRQSTRTQKALAVDSLAAAIAAINIPAMESPELGSSVARAMEDWGAATRDERILAHYFLFSFFRLCESAWYQRRADILDARQWEGWEKMARKYYHSAGVREAWWPNRGHAYSPAFQAFLAGSAPPDEIGSLKDLFDYVPRGA
ncbi:MAG TPA: hypothetical protein PLZ79_13260 [Burkholderiales bacterium]|nr:hypothetical protein [Burkholderiales bacterium]